MYLHHRKRNNVKACVEAKYALGLHHLEHARERERQYSSPEVICRNSPRHADFTMREREDFCRVSKRGKPSSRYNLTRSGDTYVNGTGPIPGL